MTAGDTGKGAESLKSEDHKEVDNDLQEQAAASDPATSERSQEQIDQIVRAKQSVALRTSQMLERPMVPDATIAEMVEAANSRLPRLRQKFVETGLAGWPLDYRMLQCNVDDWDEDALIALLFPIEQAKALTTRAAVRQRTAMIKHSVIRWWNKKNLLLRAAYLTSWAAALLGPSLKAGVTLWGGLGIAGVVIFRIHSSWKDLDHNEHPLLDERHKERQLELEQLVYKQQRWLVDGKPNGHELQDYRYDALRLINSLVRDHRSDLKGRQIYTNLLVAETNAVMVIARSDLHRRVPEIYTPEQCSLAWDTLQTGQPRYTGNVYADAPKTKLGKKYNSIIVLPVKYADTVVGAVSIDSESMYHFDGVFEELITELAPYVQLLAFVLLEDHATKPTNREEAAQ